MDTESGSIEQWDKAFVGPVERYAVAGDKLLTTARLGTEVQMYSIAKPTESLHRVGQVERYVLDNLCCRALAARSHSFTPSLGKPEEVYLADSADKLDQARAHHLASTSCLPNAISRKASPTSGRPTTAQRSKGC